VPTQPHHNAAMSAAEYVGEEGKTEVKEKGLSLTDTNCSSITMDEVHGSYFNTDVLFSVLRRKVVLS
jgi:hypothetical protein